MCDTLSIKASWSESGNTYFAKNSDHSPNEPHLILRMPGMDHAADSMVQCTYISIPQVEHTRGMILYKPSWIWGAEVSLLAFVVAFVCTLNIHLLTCIFNSLLIVA